MSAPDRPSAAPARTCSSCSCWGVRKPPNLSPRLCSTSARRAGCVARDPARDRSAGPAQQQQQQACCRAFDRQTTRRSGAARQLDRADPAGAEHLQVAAGALACALRSIHQGPQGLPHRGRCAVIGPAWQEAICAGHQLVHCPLQAHLRFSRAGFITGASPTEAATTS